MRSPFLRAVSAKKLLAFNSLLALFYFIALIFMFNRGNIFLYVALMVGEVFHIWQLYTLFQAAWEMKHDSDFSKSYTPAVDIYITVAGEPYNIVLKTVMAATKIDYPNYHIYILNDGKVAKKKKWWQIDTIPYATDPSKVSCITRSKPGGAKAGNINHALTKTDSPFIAVLDCDHIPKPEILKSMLGYFIDPEVAFVQSPQYYRNHTDNYVANAAWQQQTLFFGPICRGKARSNSLFMCGTNMVIRRKALMSAWFIFPALAPPGLDLVIQLTLDGSVA